MLFFADSGERALVQAMMIGSVTGLIVATLLLIYSLNAPFQSSLGGLRPIAMERALRILEGELADIGERETPPCTDSGDAI
jgi:hypothetical protein